MIKIRLYTAVVIASLVGLLTSIYATMALIPQSPSYPSWMGEMMGRMMGGRFSERMPQPVTPPLYAYLVPLAFTALLVVGIVGLLYSFTYPEIKRVKVEEPHHTVRTQSVQAVMKTLKPEELRVLEILKTHEGKYLQKYISKETGLSRLKVHRIVAGLAERGIVTARQYGNTNEVSLSEWLLQEKAQ